MTYDSTKYFANRGVERNKRPLKNIVYTAKVLPLSEFKINPTPEDLARLEKYKFKDLGYLWLNWRHQEKKPLTYSHGFVTSAELKEKIGVTQWSKFCQGKREFIIQRRVDGKNIKKKKETNKI